MDKATKLTLDELIRRKEQILADKRRAETAEVYVKSLNGSVIIKAPSNEVLADISGMSNEDVNKYVVYECVISPRLKNTELHEAFECAAPMDIVDKLFLPGEAAKIAQKCIDLAGFDDEHIQTVKN